MTTRDWRKLYHEAAVQTARAAAEHRRLVLAHPDLAHQLTRPPLDFKSPEQWNGSIPPYMINARNKYVRNDSAQRVHLLAIVRQAYARTLGEEIARAWVEDMNADHWTRMPPSSYERAAARAWTPHDAARS